AAAHAGGHEHHVGTDQVVADLVDHFLGGGAPVLRLRARAETLGDLHAHLDDALRLGKRQRLRIGVGDDEIDALERAVDHVVDGVAAGAADADPRAANAPRSLEILAPDHTQRYEGGRLVLDEPNPLGVLPVVHVQNASQPGAYRGMSDVEPLIPLQDELNTRLSDRAHRVTLQSFNMYLAKGIEPGPGGPMRIAPGQVWTTDNPDADIKAFGGDGHSPSEEAHIEQVRDALDKTSSVSPVAIGVIRARLGHLSSENALRITLMGVLSKTARKRVAYGRGIAEMSGLILHALDVAGVYRTRERDQRVRVEWPDPLPTDERSVLEAARLKRELGVPAERVLADLGYPPVRPPVNPPVGPPV
ncbi:MAG TPA: hypothetical protein DEB06_00435, partial [Phycisphaerales bacterium]|nr:hypothetical protein [Phycisphaerales bacterium]